MSKRVARPAILFKGFIMYILIDRENLTINHKHANPEVLCNLAWIELQTVFHVIGPCSEAVLNGFTEMELRMMYRSATGVDLVAQGRNEVVSKVKSYLETLPESDVDVDEVEYQASGISEGTKGTFKYVKGAKRPAKPQGLFSNSEKLIKTVKGSEAGRETSKAVIWRIADQLWEAAGKVTIKEEVLKLRKIIMDNLETNFGIKRTSASSELANWHKNRAPY